MLISSTRRPATKTQAVPQKQEREQDSTLADRFTQRAPSEVTKAVGYSALAGLSATAAGHILSAGSGVLPSAQALGIGAAAGACFGLVAGIGLSLIQSTASKPVESRPPEPVVPKPPLEEPTAGEIFAEDMTNVGQILTRRVGALDSLVKADRLRVESLNRQGRKAYRQAESLLEQSDREMPESRPSVVSPGDDSAVKTRLREVRNQQQTVLALSVEADTIVKDSLGRHGRYAQDQAEAIGKDLTTEANRLTAALKA